MIWREYYSMRLLIDARGYREVPEALAGVEPSDEDLLHSFEEMIGGARSMAEANGGDHDASGEGVALRPAHPRGWMRVDGWL